MSVEFISLFVSLLGLIVVVVALTCNVLVLMYAVCWSAKHSQIGVNDLLTIIHVIKKKKNIKYDTLVLQVFAHNCNIM